MPPFFGDFWVIRTAGAGSVGASAAKVEDHADDPDGEAAEGDGDPELTKGEVKTGKRNVKEVPDAGEQGLSQGGGGFGHAGGLGFLPYVGNGLRDGGTRSGLLFIGDSFRSRDIRDKYRINGG